MPRATERDEGLRRFQSRGTLSSFVVFYPTSTRCTHAKSIRPLGFISLLLHGAGLDVSLGEWTVLESKESFYPRASTG